MIQGVSVHLLFEASAERVWAYISDFECCSLSGETEDNCRTLSSATALVSFNCSTFHIIRHEQRSLETVTAAVLLEWLERADARPGFKGLLDWLCEGNGE